MKRLLGLGLLLVGLAGGIGQADPGRPIDQRFASPNVKEVPSFRQHVLPLMGRLGCNGRACHGSFQGQGGFRLSLFGYDFKTDMESLLQGTPPRVNVANPQESLVLLKPTMMVDHGGDELMKVDSWQYRVFRRWIEGGAKGFTKEEPDFVKLEVTPSEILFKKIGQTAQLKVIVHWSNGQSEDVTPLCRYRTNDETIAEVSETGLVSSLGKGGTHVVAFFDNGVGPVSAILPVSELVGPRYPQVPTPTKVDELVVQRLKKLGIVPSDLATDAEFLRRVRLDMTGTLPTPVEIEAFLNDKSSNKREKLVDRLLETPEYAAWWTTRLCDYTGNNEATFNQKLNPRKTYEQWYDWIYSRLEKNVPYDEIIAGIVLATSREPGEDYATYNKEMSSFLRDQNPGDFTDRQFMPYFWTRSNNKLAEEKALSFAYSFLGVRLQCAQCHKHPFDQWTQDDFNQFTAFFNNVTTGIRPETKTEQKEMLEKLGITGKTGGDQRRELQKLVAKGEVVPFDEVYINTSKSTGKRKDDKKKVEGSRVITPRVLGGEEVVLNNYPDPRAPLMEWMRHSDNPYFAKALVNRVWSNYFNCGIIEPPDDMNLANPPSNAALLDHLTEGFVKSKYDLKWLHREICNSRAYQASWRPNETNEHDQRNFSHAILRRLPAEVTVDALAQASAGSKTMEDLQSSVKDRAIGLSTRYRSQGRNGNYVMNVFGKPLRETNCDCERSAEPSLLQTIFMRNDGEMFTMIDRGGWMSEIGKLATQTAPAKVSGKSNAGERKDLEREIASLKDRAKELRKSGKSDQVKTLLREMRSAEEKLARLNRETPANSSNNEPAEALAVPVELQRKLVQEAYLRTVSRFPNEAELSRAVQHVSQAPSLQTGVRDILWALLNTKEFVINH